MVIVVRITTQELNKLTSKMFAAWLAQANLASKNDNVAIIKKKYFDDKLNYLNRKITSNKSKHLLVENKLKKLKDNIKNLQKFYSSLYISQSYFFSDGAQPYLIFQTLYYPWNRLGDTQKSKSLAAEKLTTPTTTDYSLSPSMN